MTSLSDLAKAAAPKAEVEQVVRGKKKQKRLSELSAGLGLAAFGTQLPKVATLASRSKRVASLRPVKRLASMAPKAQKASDAIVPASLGVGAMGSMNFARTTGQEVKVQEKELGTKVRKYDDRFLRRYKRNISTGAEEAYRDLGRRRNRRLGDAAAQGALSTGLLAAGVRGALKARTTRGMVGVAAAGGLGSSAAYTAAQNRINEAKGLQMRRDKIKAKAHERARTGELGRDRRKKDWEDFNKAQAGVSKALMPRPRTVLNMPTPKPGGVRRNRFRGAVSYRGSVPGTGRYARSGR